MQDHQKIREQTFCHDSTELERSSKFIPSFRAGGVTRKGADPTSFAPTGLSPDCLQHYNFHNIVSTQPNEAATSRFRPRSLPDAP